MKTIVVCGSSRRPCQDFAALLPATRGSLPPPRPPLAIFSVAGEDVLGFYPCTKSGCRWSVSCQPAGSLLVRHNHPSTRRPTHERPLTHGFENLAPVWAQ